MLGGECPHQVSIFSEREAGVALDAGRLPSGYLLNQDGSPASFFLCFAGTTNSNIGFSRHIRCNIGRSSRVQRGVRLNRDGERFL